MDQQRLGRVADARTLDLGVEDDPGRHLRVGRGVDVDRADALVMLHDRHLRLGGDAADQALAAPRDRQVDVLGQGQQVADRRAVGRADELDGVLREPARGQVVGQNPVQGPIRVDRFLAAAEDHRVAALDAECRRVDGHVRPALVDHEDHAQGHADLGDLQPVGPAARVHDLADRVGQPGDLGEGPGDLVDPLGIEREPVDRRRIQAEPRRRGDVPGVGLEDLLASR